MRLSEFDWKASWAASYFVSSLDLFKYQQTSQISRNLQGLGLEMQFSAILIFRSQISREIYRLIHKSLRDFRPLLYSSRDGHAEGEHINR
jgi:hypothetical protein